MSEKSDPTPNTLRLVDTAISGLTALFASEMHRVDERFLMFSTYMKEMGIAESNRLDAVRAVDATAVNVANDRAIEQASVLATQVATSAETLRALVATTASAVATSLAQVSAQLTDRIAELEKKQYESQGRSGISSPLLMMIAALAGGIIVFIVESVMGK